jgi:hypothetical protein
MRYSQDVIYPFLSAARDNVGSVMEDASPQSDSTGFRAPHPSDLDTGLGARGSR